MSDLISRRAVLKRIEKIRYAAQMMDDTHRASILMNGMHLCEEAVRNQTSAEKTGRWLSEPKPIYSEHGDEVRHDVKIRWYCSECDHTIGLCWEGQTPKITKYCCECGAKMEVEHG